MAMYLMVLVLNQKEYLNPVLERLLGIGISGATIVDSKGMGREFMECESPVMGGLRKLIYDQCRPENVTVYSVVKDEETIDQAVAEIESIVGDLSQPGKGVFFALPLARVKGLSAE